MAFTAALRESLEDRASELPAEFARGDSLEDVLNRHLITVEEIGGDDVFTCILLLSADGKRLSYGAAPTVPSSYSKAFESIAIGPIAGSCGAAAFLGRPVYSIEIETDPVWGNSRDLALQHGFRSCWSTPIRNSNDAIIGTFAILRRTMGMPSDEEIQAIELITSHVAEAIMWFRNPHYFPRLRKPEKGAPLLTLVCDKDEAHAATGRLMALARKLQSKAADLDGEATRSNSGATAENLREAAELSRQLAGKLMAQIEHIELRKPTP